MSHVVLVLADVWNQESNYKQFFNDIFKALIQIKKVLHAAFYNAERFYRTACKYECFHIQKK